MNKVMKPISAALVAISLVAFLYTLLPSKPFPVEYLLALHLVMLGAFAVFVVDCVAAQRGVVLASATGRRPPFAWLKAIPLWGWLLLAFAAVFCFANLLVGLRYVLVSAVSDAGRYYIKGQGPMHPISYEEYQLYRGRDVRFFAGPWMLFSSLTFVYYWWVRDALRPGLAGRDNARGQG